MYKSIKNKNQLEKKMKNTLSIALSLVLFASVAFADGNQGNGGRCTGEGCQPPPCEVGCDPLAYQNDGEVEVIESSDESVIVMIEEYWLFIYSIL
ncbi:hypothetical protein BH20ACI2_BH20ACI2_26480 [soil metagenome]